MKRFGFRSRLSLTLALFALVPSIVLTLAWGGAVARLLPLMSGTAAWEHAAASGTLALKAARDALDSLDRLDAGHAPGRVARARERAKLAAHEHELETSLTNAGKFSFFMRRLVPVFFFSGLVALAALSLGASKVAGSLSRQLSRPVHELVGWTERIRRGEPLPHEATARGAPEFGVLRDGMRQMADDLEAGRRSALEAARLAAFRESARQVAHELKNPLTPIRFAVERLSRNREKFPPELSDAVDVLATESARLEVMAKSFAQFGRLPEGPPSDVDVGDLVRAAARSAVPPHIECRVDIVDGVPMLHANHDALSRAVTNVLLNAVEASGENAGGGSIIARVLRFGDGARTHVVVAVRDAGVGIAADRLDAIWDPYVTHKAGGTGLGLAIVKQTVLAHGGRVEAESAPGSGTEIRLIFPVTPPVRSTQ